MSQLTSSRKNERLRQYVDSKIMISERAYNLVMGITVFYGILVNIIMCALCGDMTRGINPLVFIIGYFVCCFLGIYLSSHSTNAIISFLGYNFVVVPVGMVLSSVITAYGGLSSDLILQAFIITAGISGIMILAAIAYPSFFSRLHGILLSSLIGLIVIELILLFLHIPQIVTSWIGAIIFSLYIGFDFYMAQQYPKTVDNAVDSAMDIYLDVINLFIRILQILGSKNKD